jgi:hypothetical protein
MSRNVVPLIAALVAVSGAGAQVFYSLPKDDFIWNWGRASEADQRGMADIEVSGSESFFTCDLTARMSPSNPASPSEIRLLEMELRQRLDFIYAVSTTMNDLEYGRQLAWARLDCKRRGDEESDPETRAERESEAREKMLRELERRRERQQRGND